MRSVVLHDGRPPREDAAMFGAPPPDLGDVRSATSDDVPELRERAQTKRMAVVPLMGLLFALIGGLVGALTDELVMFLGGGIILGCVLGVLLLAALPQLHHATYVCTLGVARFARRGSKVTAEIVPFHSLQRIEVSATTYTAGGAPIAEARTFSFVGKDGRELLRVLGSKPREGLPPSEDPLHFGVAAERAFMDWQRANGRAA
jgi:hypothetical protein